MIRRFMHRRPHLTPRQCLFALLTCGWAAAIAWGSLTPADTLPRDLPWDKLNHFIAYGGLAIGLGLSGCRRGTALIAAVAFGAAIEFLQIPVPGRHGGDPADLLANGLGALSGILLGLGVAAFRERHPQRHRQ
ncbi:VanZ family protein [Salinicola avicenniae]|uniref:VanZ family protein n=1 Tax=Salinicola avicenniae TaxID=2916836 RepID=UPI0020739A82|nr:MULTISPECIES: VanZ family protein [unclassified Salinicola]